MDLWAVMCAYTYLDWVGRAGASVRLGHERRPGYAYIDLLAAHSRPSLYRATFTGGADGGGLRPYRDEHAFDQAAGRFLRPSRTRSEWRASGSWPARRPCGRAAATGHGRAGCPARSRR